MHPLRRPLGVVLLAMGYIAAFLVLQPRIGDAVVSLSMVPIVWAGWTYGVRRGMAVSVGIVALNIALMQTIGHQDGFRPSQVPRILIAIAIGGAAGWARELTQRQRDLLEQHTRDEQALRDAKLDLERMVEERTAELLTTNHELRTEIAARRDAEETIRRDARARQELEARAAAADRMAVIGTLTAGIGHEINNPLAAVTSNLEFIADQLSDASPAVVEATGDALTAALRAGEVVRNMRIFIESNADSDAADVRQVVSSTVRMVQNELRHRARLELDVQETPPVGLSTAQLGQILLNLLVNATQALPSDRAPAENVIRIRSYQVADSDRVRIEVTDSGSGIPAEVRPRIFDPFFTTKPVGIGTGLGLWVCHQIVTTAGGEISLESSNEGTTFRIDLPAVRVARDAAPALPVPFGGQRARLLVIDDDSAIRKAFARFIRGRHDVVMLEDATAALACIEGGRSFDVILCDIMMPGMNGMEFYERLQKVAPDLTGRVVFMTGGAFTAQANDFLHEPNRRLLEKPFAADRLESAIQEVLRLEVGEAAIGR